jgi:urease accessory protein
MKLISVFLLALTSTAALGHPQGSGALLHGFAHPFTGLDHLLAMLLIGLWAARRRGTARMALPLAFLGSMFAGALGARMGALLPWVEPIITVSVVVFAAALLAAARIRLELGVSLAAAFGLFHGYAHIAQMPHSLQATAFIGGMLAGTAVLHAIGLAIGLAIASRRPGLA